MTGRTPPAATIQRPDVNPSGSTPCDAVGRALRERAVGHGRLSHEEQYAADLAVLDRCELAIEHAAGCPDFFGCMGDLSRGKT